MVTKLEINTVEFTIKIRAKKGLDNGWYEEHLKNMKRQYAKERRKGLTDRTIVKGGHEDANEQQDTYQGKNSSL